MDGLVITFHICGNSVGFWFKAYLLNKTINRSMPYVKVSVIKVYTCACIGNILCFPTHRSIRNWSGCWRSRPRWSTHSWRDRSRRTVSHSFWLKRKWRARTSLYPGYWASPRRLLSGLTRKLKRSVDNLFTAVCLLRVFVCMYVCVLVHMHQHLCFVGFMKWGERGARGRRGGGGGGVEEWNVISN